MTDTTMHFARQCGELRARLEVLCISADLAIDGRIQDDGSCLLTAWNTRTLVRELATARGLLDRITAESNAAIAAITLSQMPDRPKLMAAE